MKRTLTIILAIVLMAGLVLAADKKAANADLPLDPDEFLWQFGMIPGDATVSHHYALTNKHSVPVTIKEIISDCDCTKTSRAPVTVQPGETFLLGVTFDTKTYFGETNRDIHLVTDYEPMPEMTVYFTSLAARRPNTINIEPRMTAFIQGKNSQTFVIENLSDRKAGFTIFPDNDSTLTVSPTEFTLKSKQKQEITVSPVWDRVAIGSYYGCLVVEVSRDEKFRVSIPIKINRFK